MKSHTASKVKQHQNNRATFTVRELAAYLGISDVMTYRLLQKGEIPRRKAGKKYIVPRAAVDEWLKSTPAAQGRRAH